MYRQGNEHRMARKGQRGNNFASNDPLSSLLLPTPSPIRTPVTEGFAASLNFRGVPVTQEDGRFFNPTPTLRTTWGTPVNVGVPPLNRNNLRGRPRAPLQALHFVGSHAKDPLVCVKRKIRKEVMHALRISGRRGRGGARRRTWKSDIKC